MFFGCHNHTDEGSNLRLRDSINKVPDLIEYSHELGHKGIVITEHESITSHLNALKYYNSIKHKSGWKGFKVALGNEIYLCSTLHRDNLSSKYISEFFGLEDNIYLQRRQGRNREVHICKIDRKDYKNYLEKMQDKLILMYNYNPDNKDYLLSS